MAMPNLMDKTAPRGFPWLWFIRIGQLVLTLLVLALAAAKSATFSNYGCSIKAKLGFNLATVRFPRGLPKVLPLTSFPRLSLVSSLASTSFSQLDPPMSSRSSPGGFGSSSV